MSSLWKRISCKYKIKKQEITLPTTVALCSAGLVIWEPRKTKLRWTTSAFSLCGHLASVCSMSLAKQSRNLIQTQFDYIFCISLFYLSHLKILYLFFILWMLFLEIIAYIIYLTKSEVHNYLYPGTTINAKIFKCFNSDPFHVLISFCCSELQFYLILSLPSLQYCYDYFE